MAVCASVLKMCIHIVLSMLNKLYLEKYTIYRETYLHSIIVNKRERGQKFEGDQGGIYRSARKEKREG